MKETSRIASDAIWLHWTGPVAVQSDGITFTCWVSRQGNIVVASIDHATGLVNTHVVAEHFDPDDHSAPALLIRQSDKRILFAYTKHNDKIMRWRVSQNPLD